ncbi:MAG: hypothetical protein E7616_03920 [Ruminococcaceae bacterium]|nr:hypothetical protein [Oscillospiraceae bacterium]
MKENEKSKRRIKIGITVFFVFAVVIALLSMIDFDVLYAKISGPTKIPEPEYADEDFYIADYTTDILSDPVYLELDRTLTWVEDGVSEKLSDNNYEKYHEPGILVHNYFESLIHGDADAYNALFSADYKKKFGVQENFPMQRVYEMKAEVLSSNLTDDGGRDYVIKLSYKIQGNDGTVRHDMLSDSIVPIDIKVHVTAGGYTEILSVTKYYGGDPLEGPKFPIALAIVLIAVPILLIAAFTILVVWIIRRKKKA